MVYPSLSPFVVPSRGGHVTALACHSLRRTSRTAHQTLFKNCSPHENDKHFNGCPAEIYVEMCKWKAPAFLSMSATWQKLNFDINCNAACATYTKTIPLPDYVCVCSHLLLSLYYIACDVSSYQAWLKFIHRMTERTQRKLQQGQQLKKYFNLYGKMKTLQIGFSCKLQFPLSSPILKSMLKLNFLWRVPGKSNSICRIILSSAICRVKDTTDRTKKKALTLTASFNK